MYDILDHHGNHFHVLHDKATTFNDLIGIFQDRLGINPNSQSYQIYYHKNKMRKMDFLPKNQDSPYIIVEKSKNDVSPNQFNVGRFDHFFFSNIRRF